MLADHDAASRAVRIARELSKCRQRGLDELDLCTRNQSPVSAPEMERLAFDYCAATGTAVYGRIAAIRILLHDGLAAYAARGNQTERAFIDRLFFDPANSKPKQRPSVRLEAAQADTGMDDERFTEYRRTVFAHFAAFLMMFVADATRGGGAANGGSA